MKTEYIQQLQGHLQGPISGKVPGFGGWLNAKIAEIDATGTLELDFTVREEMLNPMGVLHGGAMAAFIDEVLGFQLFLKTPDDASYVSMTMNIDFLRTARVGEVLRAIPEVIRIGKRTANVRCVLLNQAGEQVAQGVSNFMRVV